MDNYLPRPIWETTDDELRTMYQQTLTASPFDPATIQRRWDIRLEAARRNLNLSSDPPRIRK